MSQVTILSVRAVAAVAIRHVTLYGPTLEVALLQELGRYGIDSDRAAAGLRRALIDGRLVRSPDSEGPRAIRRADEHRPPDLDPVDSRLN